MSKQNLNFLKNKDEIITWLKSHDVLYFTLIEDKKYGFVVDVDDHLFLYSRKLSHIPVKFNKVAGNFNCAHNQLSSLIGCPQEVGMDFLCNDNKLTSLKGTPKFINGYFACNNNLLTSLKDGPVEIKSIYNCANNKINTLEYFPQSVEKHMIVHRNEAFIDLEHGSFDHIYQEHLRIKNIINQRKKLEKLLPSVSTKPINKNKL